MWGVPLSQLAPDEPKKVEPEAEPGKVESVPEKPEHDEGKAEGEAAKAEPCAASS